MPLDLPGDEPIELEPYNPDVLGHLSRLSQLHFSFSPEEGQPDLFIMSQASQGADPSRRTSSGRLIPGENPPLEGSSQPPHSRASQATPSHTPLATPGPSVYRPDGLGPTAFDQSHYPFQLASQALPLPPPQSSFQASNWVSQSHFPQLPLSSWNPSASAAPSMDPGGVPHPEMGSEAFWMDMVGMQRSLPGQAGPSSSLPSQQSPPLSINTALTSPVDGPPMSAGSEEKRRRNTAASARFRIKKKQRMLNLERSVADLQGRAEELEKETGELRRENGWLREMVLLKGGISPASAIAAKAAASASEAGPSSQSKATAGEKGKGKSKAGASSSSRRRPPPPVSPTEDSDSDDEDMTDDEEEEEEEEPPKASRGKRPASRKK